MVWPRFGLIRRQRLKRLMMNKTVNPRVGGPRLMGSGEEESPTKLASPGAQLRELLDNSMNGASEGTEAIVESAEKVTVAVRLRPLSAAEKKGSQRQAVSIIDRCVTVKDDFNSRSYKYDYCFDSSGGDDAACAGARQEDVFYALGNRVLAHAWGGFNSTIFAYGQTGSGKTYTMMGEEGDDEGLVPRIARALLSEIKKAETEPNQPADRFSVKVSYIEIYNERVYDLLANLPELSKSLKIRENAKSGVYVDGAMTKEVGSWEEMRQVLEQGQSARRVARTNMNVESSRSHAIFTLEFRQTGVKKTESNTAANASSTVDRVSRLCLVDLAGSERADKTGMSSDRLRETASINKSLLTLSCVINALAQEEKENHSNATPHIPYRDSALTFLLRDSLGGNSKTIMLATVSPSHVHVEESLNTLRYADRAKSIMTHARVNENPKDRRIRNLEEELAMLKRQLEETKKGSDTPVEGLPASMTDDDRDAIEQRHQMEMSTLRLQNFARATLLKKAKAQAHRPTGLSEPSSPRSISSSSSRARDASELPHLTRLSEGGSVEGEQIFRLCSEVTHFDADGCIVGPHSTRNVAFTINYSAQGRMYVTVPASCQLYVNGTLVSFCNSRESTNVDIWDGTRIATGLDRIFLVLLASADADPPLSPVSASMYALHKAVWMVLQPHHSLYLRAAQAEIRRGCQLQPEHVETLIRTGNIVDAPLKHSPSDWTEIKPPAASPPPRLVDDMRIPHTSSPAECSNLTVSEDEGQSVNTAASLNNPVSGRSSVAASEGEKEQSNDRALSVATLSSNRHSGALCRPCEPAVSKLPRLAKRSNKPFASLAAAPALPPPAGSSLAPTVMPASVALPPPPVVMPPPPPPSSSTTSSPPLSSLGIGSVVRRTPTESLAERPATRESISNKKTNLAHNNVNAGAIVTVTKTTPLPAAPVVFEEGSLMLTVPNVQDALKVVRPRFLRLAAALRERVFADFRREEFTDQLVLKVVMQIPLIAEANALAYTLDKPVTYFLDVSPRPAQPTVADTRELLQDISQSSFIDALGMDIDNALPPSQLELAAQNHIVVVRARDSLTGHEMEMSVDDLRQRVLSIRAYKARALSKLYTSGTQSPLHPEADDPFLVTTEEKTIARADISVSPLLEGKNVIGEFPILHPLNGLCIGAVQARLICDGVTPQDASEGYNVRFDLEEVKIEKAAFKGGKAASLARVLGLREQEEQLVVRFYFLNKDLSGEIPLSERSSTVRDLVSRAPEQGPHWKYPMNFSRTLNVQHVEVPFLSYLATGALKLTLVVHPDPTLRDASQGKQGARQHEGDRLTALRLAMNIEPPPHESKELVLHSQSRTGYGADDELKSEYGSDLGGADTCSVSRLSLRSATGLRPPSMTMRKSMKRSSVRSHVPSLRLSSAASGHAGVNNTTPSSILVFMAVDMMEPEIDLSRPDRPYPHQGEPRYLPVDVKRACLRMNTSTSTMASTLTGIQEVDEMDDEMSRASEPWSELDSCLTGMPTACAAEPVFRVTGTPLIPARQIRIVLEQIEPLPAFQLESCVRVRASSYVALTSQQYTGDITEHTECEINLHIINVVRSAAKRRLDIYAELPAAPILWENKHGKGDRVVVIIDVSVFLEGVVRPVTLRRNLIMKAVPPARKTSMFYNIRKSLRESSPTIDRLYQLGSYYAVRNVPPSYLTEAVADFIAFKLRAQENLWQRLDTAREYQEGASLLKTDRSSGGNNKVPQQIDQSLDSWKQVLNSPRDSDASTPSAAGVSKAAGPGNAAAAADDAYMGQVVEFMHLPTAAVPKAKERQQICAAVFGIDASLRRRASLRMDGDGVYRVSEELGEDKPVFRYSYAIRPRLPMTAQRSGAGASADDWKAVTDVEVRELADYPVGREGYLSMRTGLLGVSLSRYWFVFRRPFLVRYANKDQNTPAAILNVTDCKVSRGSDELEIVVRGGPAKTWVLQTANGTDMMEWMYALDPVSYDANMATVWRNF